MHPTYTYTQQQELGYDCVRWTNAIYHDLLRTGDGTGIGMISSYFGQVWLVHCNVCSVFCHVNVYMAEYACYVYEQQAFSRAGWLAIDVAH